MASAKQVELAKLIVRQAIRIASEDGSIEGFGTAKQVADAEALAMLALDAMRKRGSEWMRQTLEKAADGQALESYVEFSDGTTAWGEEAERAMRRATDASK